MRVALLVNPVTVFDPQMLGGSERMAFNEFKYLMRRGVEASLSVRGFKGKQEGIMTMQNFKPGEDHGHDFYAWFVESNKDANILHGHNTPLLAIVSNRQKTLLHAHNSVTNLPYYDLLETKYKRVFFAFCSQFVMDHFQSHYPKILPEKCFLLYNGVDTDLFKPTMHHRPKRTSVILYTGIWKAEKGIFVLLDALRILEDRRKDFEAVIAGSPYLYNTGEALDWQIESERAVKTAMTTLRSVRVVSGIGYDRMPDLYRSSDIFVFPSVFEEPFGLGIIESMSCATPVIASRVGGIPEIIHDGKNGLLVSPSDPKDLADSIEYLLDNEKERRRLGASGRRRVEEMFSMERHVEALMKIYQRMDSL